MQITLGDTGIVTSKLALGCARIGSALTPIGRRESVALIEKAFDLGIRHFDTASIYGQGDSERYLGMALKQRRADVCLSSKAGQLLTPKQALLSRFKLPIRFVAARSARLHSRVALQRMHGLPRCFEAGYIARSLENSLRRLGTDCLDIFYLHSPTVGFPDDAALIETMLRLRQQGRFRAIGVSCDELEVAWAAAKCDAVKVVQFAFDDSEQSRALLAELARGGKVAVLRGLMQPGNHHSMPVEILTERFARALEFPALGGVIVGTTSPMHLQANVAAFQRAENQGTTRE